jgi:hypothetical protein
MFACGVRGPVPRPPAACCATSSRVSERYSYIVPVLADAFAATHPGAHVPVGAPIYIA